MSHSFVVVGLELACSLTNGREMLPSWISNDAVGNQLHMDDGLIINELLPSVRVAASHHGSIKCKTHTT